MTLVENLQTWKDAVEYYNKGDFQSSLDKFKEMKESSAKISFNIGRAYLSLCDLQAALQAFQEVIKKDEHLAVGHFMLGVVNLMCRSHSEALVNFNETFRNLRESKFIDYKQLGMRYKLYKCEVLLNRAVCLSSLGYIDGAVEDLLSALQCKVEPRHSIIDISLNNVQNGQSVEFLVMDAIFQPPKSKTANLGKIDYLGKSQVVVDTATYETMETPLHLRGRLNTAGQQAPSDSGVQYKVLYDFIAQHVSEASVKAGDVITVVETAEDGWFTMLTNDARKTGLVPGSYLEKYDDKEEPLTSRQALLKDLRKKESRQSLRKVQPPMNKQSSTGSRPRSSITESTHIYANGLHTSHTERPKTVDLGGLGKNGPKPPPKAEPKIHAGPPKFRRNTSLENLLANKSPKTSPVSGKKMFNLKKVEVNNNNDSDDDGYEEIPMASDVRPYAVHDIAPGDKMNGRRKGPERPAPPPKVFNVMTMRPSSPIAAPRVPRANTVSSPVVELKLGSTPPTAVPRPTKPPPKVPQPPPKVLPQPPKVPPQSPPRVPQSPSKVAPQSPSRVRNRKDTGREVRSQNVALQFTVATSLTINASTTAEDIQNAAKEAITRNIASYLWCEKDGKRIRLDEQRASNISDLVKDGKLKISCVP